MSHAISAVIGSFFSVVNVMILLGVIFGIFAILGMSLFGGMFWSCSDEAILTQAECVSPLTWTNEFYNFDSFISSLQTLFVVASLENWYPIALNSIRISGDVEIGLSAEPSNKTGMFFFFVFIW